jgi:hypothetical protein
MGMAKNRQLWCVRCRHAAREGGKAAGMKEEPVQNGSRTACAAKEVQPLKVQAGALSSMLPMLPAPARRYATA